jgi:4-amino-4-deoxy-L-arabinose transferase-like glycosyltransferase
MDADYYFTMGRNLASGGGLSEPFIWNYLDDPRSIPHPAFQYWMPVTSFLAALAQVIFGAGFRSAQIPFILLAASFPLFTAWIALKLHGNVQSAWEAGLLAAFPGFFLPFMVTTDAFSIYGILGSLIFILSAEAFHKGGYLKWFMTGLLIGIAYLTRTDGLLFLPLCIGLIFYSQPGKKKALIGLIMGFLLVMLPWWILNAVIHGDALPSGTIRVLWMRDYDELFIYPPSELTFQRWLDSGLNNILLSRVNALWMNIKSLILVNGLVFLGPLMVIGARILRKNLIVRLASIYLISLLIVMSFVFPFAGSRGGYFHSSIAVMPILWALAPLGLRRAVEFGAQYRHWNTLHAKEIFVVASVVLACLITLGLFWTRVIGDDFFDPTWPRSAQVYGEVARWFDKEDIRDIVVAVNNPPGFYAASGLEAVVIPDGDLKMLREVTDSFQVQWLILDSNYPKGLKSLYDAPQNAKWLELKNTLDDTAGKDLFIFKVKAGYE